MPVDLSAFKYQKRSNDDELKSVDKKGEKFSASESPDEVVRRKIKRQAETNNSAVKKIKRDQSKESEDKKWAGPLPPILESELKIVFVGFNPGMESARLGHYYAHPSNRFWKFLFWSKITKSLHTPFQDKEMPELYRIGFTDLVSRATKGITQLSKAEMLEGAEHLDSRIGSVNPEIVCFVGKGIWECVARAYGWNLKDFAYGLDPHHRFGNNKSKLYCVASTSGLNSISAEKQLVPWNELQREINSSELSPEQDD